MFKFKSLPPSAATTTASKSPVKNNVFMSETENHKIILRHYLNITPKIQNITSLIFLTKGENRLKIF